MSGGSSLSAGRIYEGTGPNLNMSPVPDVAGRAFACTLGKGVQVKIGAWNVRTMGVKGKLENVKREMVRNGLNMLGVSEVRWNGNGDFESDDFRVIYSGGEERQRGIAIILDRDTARRVMSADQISDRLMVVKIQGEPIEIVLIQIYMPTTNHEDEEVVAMYEK